NPSINLTAGCLEFLPDFDSATRVHITLPASKTDPFQKGITIVIAAAPGRPTCANPSHPLFRNAAGTSLDCSSFIKRIRQALQSAGFNQSAFSGHSFCRGAATSAFAAGFTEYEIQLLGRWRSDAYKLYIEIDEARRLHISSQLHWAHPHESLSFEPPALHSLPFMA
ncbi:hypothetical protein F5890DRAFT_1421502, partial [Lentinula detonsa]